MGIWPVFFHAVRVRRGSVRHLPRAKTMNKAVPHLLECAHALCKNNQRYIAWAEGDGLDSGDMS